MPGVGVSDRRPHPARSRRRLQLPTAGHLASYAGLALSPADPDPIRGEHPNRAGNKHLKNALFMSAFAALRDPESRAYYDRKRAAGKKHNAALICLARRRCDVLYAMPRNHTPYQAKTPKAA